MPAKGHRKHKCKGCVANRSTAGDFCSKCVEKFLNRKKRGERLMPTATEWSR